MKKSIKKVDFDEVIFINSGKETKEILDAKEYLKDIQQTVNIADLEESLFYFDDFKKIDYKNELEFFNNLKTSIFSNRSLAFLEKTKLLTSFNGFNTKILDTCDYEVEDNYIYLNNNLLKHCTEFITAIWDCIILIKMSHAKNKTSVLLNEFNNLFSSLTKAKTGNEDAYIKKDNNLDMICEVSLFLQFYINDFFIYLIKSREDFSSLQKVKILNKNFEETLIKSSKIKHRLKMLEQIKSNNYQHLLKLLINQKNSEL